MSRKQRKLPRKPWITKGILTSISKKKKISIFRTHFITGNTVEKIGFGVTAICSQKSNPCLKRFIINLNLLTTKKIA